MSADKPFDFAGLVTRAATDNPDGALILGIERAQDASRNFGRARSKDLRAAAADWNAAQEIVTNHHPVTQDGLLAKLRYAAKLMHKCRATSLQYSALLDAIAWLEPPAPPKRRRAARKSVRGSA